MRLTERQRLIVDLVCRMRALTGDQIKTRYFTRGGDSLCQLNLTRMVREQWLDVMPRSSVTAPAIYVLSRRSVKGNRLMREKVGEATFRRLMFRIGSINHLLAINEFRVRLERACSDLGWYLKQWQQPQDLAPRLSQLRLVPDGYFQIQRLMEGQVRTASFFLETELASKSSKVLESKLLRYGELYYSGRYEQVFGTRGLRVLVVFGGDDNGASSRRIEQAMEQAKRIGVTIARFATLNELKIAAPVKALTDAMWHEPGKSEIAPLLTVSAVSGGA